MRSWLKHANGTAALLELRGEEQLNSEFGRVLFVQARTQIISACYQTRSPIPGIVIHLTQQYHKSSADPLEDLIPIVFRFCKIRAVTPFHPPVTQPESTTRVTIACYTSIAQALIDWHDGIPAEFRPSIIPASGASPDISSEYYTVYEDIWTAGMANNYRTNSILVHEALISQLSFLRDNYPHNPNQISELEDQISHSRNKLLSLIHAVCASVPYLLQSNFAAAGVGLLWTLYVSAQISPRIAPLDDGTRSWMVRRLEMIGAEMGVRQATTLVGILRGQVEVAELLKDG